MKHRARPGGATPAAGTPPLVVLILIIMALRVPSAPTGRNVDINRRWPAWRAAWLRSRPADMIIAVTPGSIRVMRLVVHRHGQQYRRFLGANSQYATYETYILTPAATAHCLSVVHSAFLTNGECHCRAGLRHWGAPCQSVMGALPFPPLPFPLRPFPPPSPLSPSPPSRPLFCHISPFLLPFLL